VHSLTTAELNVMNTCTHWSFIYTNKHTQTQLLHTQHTKQKQSLWLLLPSESTLRCLTLLMLTLQPCAVNPLGQDYIVTLQKGCPGLKTIEIAEPQVPKLPHTTRAVKHFLLPVYTRYPLMLLLGGLLHQPPSASVSTHKHMHSHTDTHPHTQSDMHIDYKQVKQTFGCCLPSKLTV